MSGWVVRTHPPMIKLVFWKLLENRVFLWECCSVIFVKDVYPPESLLRVYRWVRKYGPTVLTGPIVMIATHRVAKQSWRFWCEVATIRKVFKRRMSPQFMTLGIRDASSNLRRLGNVLSSVSCIKDEWQFRRLGRQYYRSLLFDCRQKWIRRIASIWRAKLSGESESLATDVLRISVTGGSGHVCPGKLNRPPLPSDDKHWLWSTRRWWNVSRTGLPSGWNEDGCLHSRVGGLGFYF